MRIPCPTNYVFDVVLAWILVLLIFVQAAAAQAVNTTVDNTSPLLQYSPQPCFRTAPPNCSPEWSIEEFKKAFNGSTTSTNGTGAATGLDILPRVTLTFQGDSILFVPGPNSNASATVVVDDLPSILVNTATNAFTGSGLDPKQFHTITVTFVPSTDDELSILEIDYFTIGQSIPLNSTTTLKSSTTLTPAPIPTSSSSPTLMSTSLPSSTSSTSSSPSPTSEPVNNIITSTRPAPGTIAAISLSAALLILLAGMAWLLVLQRRRRRQRAARREAEILQGTRMPSEMYGMGISPISPAAGNRYSTGNMDALLAQNQPQPSGEGKGKARMRESVPPPVHYTPWR